MSRKTMGQITHRYAAQKKYIMVLILDPTPLSLEAFYDLQYTRPPQTDLRGMGERGYNFLGDCKEIDRLVCGLGPR
jgi:hypothetical protein